MEAYKNAFVEEAEERGEKRGIEQGIEKNSLAVARKMLEEKIHLETIARVTGLSMKRLKELQRD